LRRAASDLLQRGRGPLLGRPANSTSVRLSTAVHGNREELDPDLRMVVRVQDCQLLLAALAPGLRVDRGAARLGLGHGRAGIQRSEARAEHGERQCEYRDNDPVARQSGG